MVRRTKTSLFAVCMLYGVAGFIVSTVLGTGAAIKLEVFRFALLGALLGIIWIGVCLFLFLDLMHRYPV